MFSPSYIVKNHNGIYYFRYIIPISQRHKFSNKGREFRRSLKTRCRKTALVKARFLWVAMSLYSEKFIEAIKNDQFYMEALNIGKKLLDEENRITEYEKKTFDYTAREDFMAHMNDYERQCLFLAQDHQETLDQNAKQEAAGSHPQESPAENAKPSEKNKIADVLDEYINEKKQSIKNEKTIDTYISHCKLFIKIIGKTIVEDIGPETIRKFKQTLPKLPKNINQSKEFKGRTIQQILDSKPQNTISRRTVKNIFTNVSGFLKWLNINHYLTKDFSDMLAGTVKINKRPDQNRAVFTIDDLNKLFSIPEYQSECFRGYPFRYWVPLLGLYTGARENELCQLYLEDIYEIEGILIIDINEKGEKQLKNLSSARIVPVHKKLLSLGFRDYLEELKKRKENRIFPNLTKDRYGKYTRKFSRFFNNDYKGQKDGLLGYCGIEKKSEYGKKDFHALRHTFINTGKQLQLNERILKEIVGHSQSDMTFDTYGKGYEIKTKQKEINKVKFDVVHPKKWERRFY